MARKLRITLILCTALAVIGGIWWFFTQYSQRSKAAEGNSTILVTNSIGTQDGNPIVNTPSMELLLHSSITIPTPVPDPFAGKKYGLAISYDGVEKLGLPSPFPLFSYTLGGDHMHTVMFCTDVVIDACAKLVNGEYEIVGQASLENYISQHPGDYWTLHNEVELPFAIDVPPDKFARIYRKVYLLIKNKDPNAKVYFPGIGTNADNYKTYVPKAIEAYKQIPKNAGESSSLPTDLWAFHVYPTGGETGSCENQAVYEGGLENSKRLVKEFISFAQNLDGGVYASKPIWMTEWAWLHNARGEYQMSEDLNTPCVAKYVKDFLTFIDTTPIDKILYFPSDFTVGNAPWCDAVYKPGYAQPYWHCWSGWLMENGRLTDVGRMYSCVANHDESKCPRFDGPNLLSEQMQFNDLEGGKQYAQEIQEPGTYEFSGSVAGDGQVQVDVYPLNGNNYLRGYENGARFTIGSDERFYIILRANTGAVHFRATRLNKLSGVLGLSVNAQTQNYTAAFKIAESLDALGNAQPISYTQDPMPYTYILKDTTPGLKTLYVRFEGNSGQSSTAQVSFLYSSVSCVKAKGDADCNGEINVADFAVWRSAYANDSYDNTVDFNNDRAVDILDFAIWRQNLE
jgi:hypothetical protein